MAMRGGGKNYLLLPVSACSGNMALQRDNNNMNINHYYYYKLHNAMPATIQRQTNHTISPAFTYKKEYKQKIASSPFLLVARR